ncbi:MAG: Maf family protein [Tissierella sp.]|uniref:Maf family protein n=1 Tax=Tissierella sp. TaxID=41274 RepID=UPI003F94617A
MNDIILASASQRRKDILEKYNLKFKIMESHIKETVSKYEGPEELAMSLAFRKAYKISVENPNNIVIGADTVVYYKGKILSKPKDYDDALRMLNILSGNTHEVITGISLINLEKKIKIVDFEKTKVKFRQLDKDIIDTYVSTGEPFDKAGSYGIQGLGALLVDKIEGSYLSVVGLPLVKLDKILNKFFDISIINMNK